MRKPLAGKRLFEAMGRRASTQGLPIDYERAMRGIWPGWARSAWARGWIMQPSGRQLTASIVNGLSEQAAREGKTLEATAREFVASLAGDEEEEPVDDYGNPLSGDRLINCCFPDCGCDGARLCMAENGASSGARSVNIERGLL